ncbi:MAG: hypothetical protein GY822_15565 [Deltaproteobacteria bacterium]|nr:hypothetical protein [Deltaproteobacteria bacterium]
MHESVKQLFLGKKLDAAFVLGRCDRAFIEAMGILKKEKAPQGRLF